jgi:gamma-glutamyltranspeptidase
VRKNGLFFLIEPFLITPRSLYQDRLGTNIGKTPKQQPFSLRDPFFGGMQGVCIHENGALSGGADPRRDGVAMGF